MVGSASVIPLPRSTPESQGIPSPAILRFLDEAERSHNELHSFMLLRYGCVVAEGWWTPFQADQPHPLFSLSKSFTSTGVGLAVAEGLLALDDPVLSFFPQEAPVEVSANLAAMTVWHLLTMSTGHAEDTFGSLFQDPNGNWAKAFLEQPVVHQPGSSFLYNSGASYMLSAIVQKVSGVTLLDYLQPRLYAPLGIQDVAWETCPLGVNAGGWGLNLKTEDIARFGQLVLQKGMWNGQRLIPDDWVEAATSVQISNGSNPDSDWEQGYGYQFWCCRHGACRGDGAFGQFCIVMPAQRAVLAITARVDDMQAVLNLVWECLLSAMGPSPLPEDEPAWKVLRQRLETLNIPA